MAFNYTDMDRYKLPDIDFSRPKNGVDRKAKLAKEKADIDQLCDEVADTYMVRYDRFIKFNNIIYVSKISSINSCNMM